MSTTMALPEAVAPLIETLRSALRVRVVGGGSKAPLSRVEEGETLLDLGSLRGVVQYRPSEYTVTVLAGTPVLELEATLAEHRQYLPFEPLLPDAGATLGGTVAAAANGPGRVRYGGVRDFLLAVRFLDGEGRLVTGGAPVVKNAAGFDLPKLMVGSGGGLGVLVELTFKVFPRPSSSRTLQLVGDRSTVLAAFELAIAAGWDLDGLEAEVEGDEARLWLRVTGELRALEELTGRWRRRLLAASGDPTMNEIDDDGELWRRARNLAWRPPGCGVVRVPSTPGRLAELENGLQSRGWLRRWASGGHQLLVAVPAEQEAQLHHWLETERRQGLPLVGPMVRRRLGCPEESPLLDRLLPVLDPRGVLAGMRGEGASLG